MGLTSGVYVVFVCVCGPFSSRLLWSSHSQWIRLHQPNCNELMQHEHVLVEQSFFHLLRTGRLVGWLVGWFDLFGSSNHLELDFDSVSFLLLLASH